MKKRFIIIPLILSVFLISGLVYATAPPPAPTCLIKGTIQNVTFKEASDHPCLSEGLNSCPSDSSLHYPDRYIIQVAIQEVSYISGPTEYITCDWFSELKIRPFQIQKKDVKKEILLVLVKILNWNQ